ncbi:MAG: PDZ domain-containing protein [Phycisphaerae bacterium]|nr:PDZ domain-containing protein [Phycisphaerae bacterium]
MNTTRTIRLGVALLLASAGTTWAQSGAFDKPLAASASGGSSTVIMRSADGDDTFEITIKSDKITAKKNGNAIPADRIRRSGDAIEILDKSGNVERSFSMPQQQGGAVVIGPGGRTATMFGAGGAVAPEPPAPPTPPAKVMIGINMSEPSEALLEHLGLDAGSCVQVDRVIEGLPAAKAGLKVKDLIVAVDGKRPVTPDSLRASLNEKEPGDTVELTVLRRGIEKTIQAELAAFDSSKLQMQPEDKDEEPQAAQNEPLLQAEKQLQEAMKQLRLRQGGQATQGWRSTPDATFWVTPDRGQPMYFQAQNQDMDKKLANIEKRLGDLSKQLERLGNQLDKLADRLESQGERRGR